MRRFFADAKPKPTRNGAPSRSSPAAGEAAGDEPGEGGRAADAASSEAGPARARGEGGDAFAEEDAFAEGGVASREGDRRHAEISATAAAAQAAKAAVFEAARAAAAAAKPAGSDGGDAEENAVGFFFHDAPRARGTRRKPTDVAALTANVAAVPRVATLDDASRLAEARDELAAVAAADRAADSVEKLTRATRPPRRGREALAPVADTPEPSARGAEGADANGDGFDKSMPARRQPRPATGGGVLRAGAEDARAPRRRRRRRRARARAQAEALAAIKARAAARARRRRRRGRRWTPRRPRRRRRRGIATRRARPGRPSRRLSRAGSGRIPFATGAAGLGEIAPRADGASAERTRLRRETPPASPSPPPPARPASATRDWPASPECAAAPSEAASADTEGGPLMPSAPPRKKGRRCGSTWAPGATRRPPACPPAGGATRSYRRRHGGDRGSEARRPRGRRVSRSAVRGRAVGTTRRYATPQTPQTLQTPRCLPEPSSRSSSAWPLSRRRAPSAARSARVPPRSRASAARVAGPVDSRRVQVRVASLEPEADPQRAEPRVSGGRGDARGAREGAAGVG